MNTRRIFSSMMMSLATMAGASQAAPVQWVDWTSAPSGAQTLGTVIGVDVTASSDVGHAFSQTGPGTNFWSPQLPYVSPEVDNAPPAADIIGLSAGGTETITFSRPVVDPLIALVSWNGNTVQFSGPIEILSYGAGYWGDGVPQPQGGTGFVGIGEVHGTIRLKGTYTSFSFTHTSENWHGFTVGIVPEPAAWWLTLAALPVVAAWGRRRRA